MVSLDTAPSYRRGGDHARMTLRIRCTLGRPACLPALALAATPFTFPVEVQFVGRSLADRADPTRTIVLIYNPGFSRDTAGTYKPGVPPILQLAVDRNPDVVLFSQVRNASRLERTHHSDYIEAAVERFRQRDGIPPENIILVGQSCGGWGSLQAAAFTVPDVGGVVAFAPTCHGQLPHSSEVKRARESEIAQLAARARFPGVIFLYEGDSYYDLADWAGFEARARRAPDLKIARLARGRVLEVCARCPRGSHDAMSDARFGAAFFASHVQPLIDQVRERIRARAARSG